MRHAESGLFDTLAAKLARWSEDNAEAVHAARPDIPEVGNDRAADNWEPLLQIADVAGGAWPDTARRAMLKLCGSEEATQSTGAELLSDIKAVFEQQGVTRISSADLLCHLCEDDEALWKTWNRGKEMTARQLSKRLGEYEISSANIKFAYGDVRKGYRLEQFTDTFGRYLAPDSSVTSPQKHARVPYPPDLSATPLPFPARPGGARDSEVADTKSGSATQNLSATSKPLSDKGGSGVADKNGVNGDEYFFPGGVAEKSGGGSTHFLGGTLPEKQANDSSEVTV